MDDFDEWMFQKVAVEGLTATGVRRDGEDSFENIGWVINETGEYYELPTERLIEVR